MGLEVEAHRELEAMRNTVTGIAVALLVWGLTPTDLLAGWLKYENHADCHMWNKYPPANDTATWSGSCKERKADGYGIHVWRWKENGKWLEDKYTGTMRANSRHGRGTVVWANGDRYEGEWKDDKIHGRGVQVWANGGRYEGEYRDDKKHGHGVQTWANGDSYDGEWKNDNENGRGVLVWANGDIYDGEHRDGKKHGRGRYTYASGNYCDREYRNDKIVSTYGGTAC